MPSERKTVALGPSAAAVQPRHEDWGTLIERTANGEEAALAALYDGTAALVNGLALRILGDRGAAEEVTGDVYLQVWRQAERYDDTRGTPLTWLLTLARTRAIDRLRAMNVRRARTEPLRAARTVPTETPGPEERSVVRQRRQLVQRALGRIPAEQRRAIELAYFEGLSHSEIAVAVGAPLGTVKTRVRLGLGRLRDALGIAGKDVL